MCILTKRLCYILLLFEFALAGIATLPLCAQKNSQLIIASGLAAEKEFELVVESYNGFNNDYLGSVFLNSKHSLIFHSNLKEGVYRLSIPSMELSQFVYCNGSDNIELKIVSNKDQKEELVFGDLENLAYSDVNMARAALDEKLDAFLDGFNPSQIDSFYLSRLIHYQNIVQEAYRLFNNRLDDIASRYPNTFSAETLSLFFRIALFDDNDESKQFYDNQDAYFRDHFFDYWPMDDPNIRSIPEVRQNVDKYFRFYSERDYTSLVEASDRIINSSKNPLVKNHLSQVLIDFFSKVQEDEVVRYIVDKHMQGFTEELSTNGIMLNESQERAGYISEIYLPDFERNYISLSEIYTSSELTLIYFWSADCNSCQEIHPYVQNAKEIYKEELNVYSICLESNETKWRNIVDEFEDKTNMVIASGEDIVNIVQSFNIKFTPMLFIVDNNGLILDKDILPEQIENSIKTYLK